MDINNPISQQEDYLHQLRNEQVLVSIYLVNGIRLSGTIEAFDNYTIMLRNGVTQVVFKHAISSIIPNVGPELRTAAVRSQFRRFEH